MDPLLTAPPRLVLFDRDGTLVVDVPYNTDPRAVEPMPTAPEAVDLIRETGIATGVVTNQSGVGRGLITTAQLTAVNSRVDQIFGPFDLWRICPHAVEEHCGCRKPHPGMVESAAAELGVAASDVVVIGDIGADIEAATAAGARGILVPTALTRPDEIAAAPIVAATLIEAARLVASMTLQEAR